MEQFEYEHKDDPQPKCKTAGCNNDNRAFNGGMCLQHSPTTNNKSECCGAEVKHNPDNALFAGDICSKCGKPFVGDSLRKQEERDFHPLDCQCIKCQMSSEFHHPDCEHCKEVREAKVATKQEEMGKCTCGERTIRGDIEIQIGDMLHTKRPSGCTRTPKVATSEKEKHSMLCAGRNFGENNKYFYSGNYKGMKEPENCNCKEVVPPHESSEKGKCNHNNPDELGNCYDCGIDQFIDTPHESEDWEAEFDKEFENILIQRNDGNFEDTKRLKDFIRKSYQRGREEGSAKKGEAKRVFYMQGYEAGKAKLLSLAVQEIEKEKVQNKGQINHGTIHTEVGAFNAGLDKAKSIISGLMKK